MEIYLIKTLSGHLKPAFDSDYENFKKIPLNEVFKVEYKKTRNIKFHRKFFALINLVFSNQEVYSNIEHLRKHLTIASGFYDTTICLETGAEIKEAKSISFSSMDEVEFSELYNRFIDTIHKYFGIDKQDLIDNIDQYF